MIKDTLRFAHPNTLLVAHRGLSGLETENTVTAFVAAANRSYFGIETDVRRTVDGKLVLFHDKSTKRIAIDDLVIEESTFDTLRALQLCSRDGVKDRSERRIATLEEYIAICRDYGKKAVLELKSDFTLEEMQTIVTTIEGMGYLDGVIFISFYYQPLLYLRQLKPTQSAQFLTSQWSEDLPAMLHKDGLDLDILYRELTEARVQQLHALGIVVNCWTCDDPEAAAQLCAWGVDQITSNILE